MAVLFSATAMLVGSLVDPAPKSMKIAYAKWRSSAFPVSRSAHVGNQSGTIMARLTTADLRCFSQCVEDLYRCQDIAVFPRHVMTILPRFIRGLFVSYTEVNPARNRAVGLLDPPTFDMSQIGPLLMRLANQHPLIDYYQRTGDGRAAKISDFLSSAQWHRTQLYQEVYRPMRVEDQMSITLPAPMPIAVGMVVSRERRDFTQRDRTLLNLFRPHMVAAYELADRFSRLKHDATTSSEAVDLMNVGLIRVSRRGEVTFMSVKARHWIQKHLPESQDPALLPEVLSRWLARMRRSAGADLPPAMNAPLRLEGNDEVLEIRWKPLQGDDLLLLECHPRSLLIAQLEPLGLTPREAQAIYWVTEGKTNAEIGIILGMSARTAQKHLQRSFRKLGVETRTAAAMRAAETWRATRR
jgi:DNA-binding CsgD family transcriptional regulator